MHEQEQQCAPAPTRCPVETTLEVIGGKWKPLIVYYLSNGTKRFNELQRMLPQVTRQMLTQHLRELEADGIVHREIYAQVPPKVEYSLTELGETVRPMLETMVAWGAQYEARQQSAP
ncbi:MAG: helix-turn-helix transcriptional regulator [Pleurocapsa minor GSE-CHR-MK-17-07R]|jgi:DNA-binding HxlR family transcriptional regulator|nr:helix-turn-helix transcriptional regulator [Pleurocapsa minor GSE-CHR-MK 17-07R]